MDEEDIVFSYGHVSDSTTSTDEVRFAAIVSVLAVKHVPFHIYSDMHVMGDI